MSQNESPVAQEHRRGRRPSPEQTQKTRAAILAAAVALFLKQGFAETRMDQVAQQAQVAKGTLYKYFPNKLAMLEAVFAEVVARPLLAIPAAAALEGEPVQALLRRTLLPWLRTGKTPQLEGMFRLIILEASRMPDVAAVYRRVVLDPLVGFLQRMAALARARGELRAESDALERFPMLLMTPALMTTVWNGLHGAGEQLNAADVFEALLDLVFAPRIP